MAKTVSIQLPTLPHIKIVATILLLSVAVIGTFWWDDVYTFARYRDPGEREARLIELKIDNKILLPQGLPALATVEDATKINRGGVLAGAKNGDKLLLYYDAGKAILYRPDAGRVVAIGPIVLDASASQVKGTRVVVRNGSGDDKKLASAITLLNDRYREANIAEPEDASRNDFPKSIVIDLTKDGSKAQFTGAITELLGAQKGILPQGESEPDADILIIIGKD